MPVGSGIERGDLFLLVQRAVDFKQRYLTVAGLSPAFCTSQPAEYPAGLNRKPVATIG
jgi:hypothetical protein